MSNKCADQSDVSLMTRTRRFVPKGSCDCDCDDQHHDFTPMGFMCAGCGHLQRSDF